LQRQHSNSDFFVDKCPFLSNAAFFFWAAHTLSVPSPVRRGGIRAFHYYRCRKVIVPLCARFHLYILQRSLKKNNSKYTFNLF